jgi:hemerythrin-like metal-binding protein
MALMAWKDAYSVGNALLDSQHKQLIELVNDVNGDADLGEVLDGLRRYGDAHFRAEESLLEAARYPDLEQHRKHHEAFRAWLAEVIAARRSGGDAAVARRDVHHYLSIWLANHLLVADKAFEPWLD